MSQIMQLEPARVYAIVMALWALTSAIAHATGHPIPSEVQVAVDVLIAALVGVDLRRRVTPVARPRTPDGEPLYPATQVEV